MLRKLIHRQLSNQIIAQRNKFPVIAVTGPRQSGKTTLLKSLFKGYQYVSLEDPDMLAFATSDPVGFLNQYNQHAIFDEAQRAPALFSYIQTRVDNSGIMGQFVLSGSQNFHLMQNITQSLAGRVALFRLLPLDVYELKQHDLLPSDYANTAAWGFYPAIYDRDIQPAVFYSNYLQTYVERDVSEILNIKDKQSFQTFLRVCAGRAGQLLNTSALANDCNIANSTAKAWLSTLESSYLIFRLYPYYENFGKRLLKSPKLYFYDTGLLCHLLGIQSGSQLKQNRQKGNIFENMVIAELQKMNDHRYQHKQYYFWQDSNANEIDALVKTAEGFDAFEIKATETISTDLFKGLDKFETFAAPQPVSKTLIYGGTKDQSRSNYKVKSWQLLGE